MEKNNITVDLAPAHSGFWWRVRIPGKPGSRSTVSSTELTIGAAVDVAYAEVKKLYAATLGDVSFVLRDHLPD